MSCHPRPRPKNEKKNNKRTKSLVFFFSFSLLTAWLKTFFISIVQDSIMGKHLLEFCKPARQSSCTKFNRSQYRGRWLPLLYKPRYETGTRSMKSGMTNRVGKLQRLLTVTAAFSRFRSEYPNSLPSPLDLPTLYTVQIPLTVPWTTDVQMVDFRCPRVAWQFWTAVLFPAVKQRLETGKKSWKTQVLLSAERQEAICGV